MKVNVSFKGFVIGMLVWMASAMYLNGEEGEFTFVLHETIGISDTRNKLIWCTIEVICYTEVIELTQGIDPAEAIGVATKDIKVSVVDTFFIKPYGELLDRDVKNLIVSILCFTAVAISWFLVLAVEIFLRREVVQPA